MAKNRVIIELSPARLQLAVVRGRTLVAMQSSRLAPPAQGDRNDLDFATSQVLLQAMVKELNAGGLEATVLYSNSTATAGVFSCAVSAGADATTEAARLALADSAEFNLELSPFDLIRLCADEPLKGGEADAQVVAQTHTVGVADTDRAVAAIFAWVAQSGLIPTAVVPINAVGLSECVEVAISASRVDSKAVAVALHLGEHSSLLAGATRGRLRFVRQISLGVEALVDAVLSAAREASISVTPAEAADVLMKFGIPQRSQELSADGRLTGAMVLPLIQPVLQRMVVELKQSLRFGVEAAEREHVHLSGLGPGSAVAKFISVIAEQSGAMSALDGGDGSAAAQSACVTQTWLGSSIAGLGLLPRQMTSTVEASRMRHALWVGAVATGLLIGVDAWSTSLDLRQQELNLAQLRSRLEAARPVAELSQRLTALQSAVARASAARDARFRMLPDGAAVLAMLARHTPPNIKLMHVQVLSEDQVPVCHVSGRATALNGVDPDATMRAYIDSLSGVPLVLDCKMGGTRRGATTEGNAMQTFELSLRLVDVPMQVSATVADLSKEDGK